MRLDLELIERDLAPSRSKAQELIKNNYIFVNDKLISKPSFEIKETDDIKIKENKILKYVSRAGLKLEKATKSFNLDLNNKIILDIGSSTGGFTDCAIQNGAKKVIAVDVGSNLMNETLRQNSKVELYEKTNILNFPSAKFKDIDFITIDVSFTSLEKIFEKISNEKVSLEIMALIKPQFECGKQIADKFKGIINSPQIHKDVITKVIEFANNLNIYIQELDYSPIKGGDGNIEYITLFSTKAKNNNSNIEIDTIITSAFNKENL